MRNALSIGLALALAVPILASDDVKQPPTPQIQRGHDLFVKPAKGVACATCHRMGGEGIAIGPDLTTMGTQGTPHVIVMTMHMTMTNYVQSFKTVGGTFPGMLKAKTADDTEVWDLSQMPPALQRLPNKQIISTDRDSTWKHPPASVEYSSQELADLIGYLRWAATGAQKEVKASEVADLK
ncbi:MAG: c-type cytochrome [Acidobacteriia bacterium]|nr:c-type cytochrome [Terriglobia bacterium]